jgi:hypothetical protein
MVGESVVFVDGPQQQMRKLSFWWSRDTTCLLYVAESRVNGRLMRGIVIHDMVVDGSIVLDTVQFINLIARALHPVLYATEILQKHVARPDVSRPASKNMT